MEIENDACLRVPRRASEPHLRSTTCCCYLTVTAHMQTVATTPASTARSANSLRVAVALAQTTRTLSSRSETTKLTVLVHGITNPVHLRIPADGFVGSIDHDDLEVLVGGILGNPVRVQDAETTDTATNTFLQVASQPKTSFRHLSDECTYLGNGLQTTVWLELVDTVALGLAVRATLGDRAFATTAANADAEDREALLGPVSQTASLVRAGRTRRTVEFGHLAVLPDANTQQVAHHIALLLAIQFLDVSTLVTKSSDFDQKSHHRSILPPPGGGSR
uniref:Uncharacterized protein n=1 Tax=Anopheles atroparvus TaxID=41427 RepID=A0A182ILW8_ANOAO